MCVKRQRWDGSLATIDPPGYLKILQTASHHGRRGPHDHDHDQRPREYEKDTDYNAVNSHVIFPSWLSPSELAAGREAAERPETPRGALSSGA